MAKYDIGDKVKVRDDLREEIKYYMEGKKLPIQANSHMTALKKSIVTISGFSEIGRYHIKEDDWQWTDEMFEGRLEDIYIPCEKVSNLKPGDKVRVREDLEEEEYYHMYKSSHKHLANEDMVERAGQVVTIKGYDTNGCYYIEEDIGENFSDRGWHWTDEMFSEKVVLKSSSIDEQKPCPISNLKVGDKVRVRLDLDPTKKYQTNTGEGSLAINSEMCKFKGQIVTIDAELSSDYHIKEDCGDWFWTNEMFSEKISKIERKFKVGDKVRFRSDLRKDMKVVSEEGNSLSILDSMAKYAGTFATITQAHEGVYTVDSNLYDWYAGAFEDKMVTGTVANFEGIEIKTKPPFKAGDKVMVRIDLKEKESYRNISNSASDSVTKSMLQLCGKVCTIKDYLGKYYLEEDDSLKNWTEEMFVLDEHTSEKELEKKIESIELEPIKESRQSLPTVSKEDLVARQYFIPTRLEYLAERYPTVTWTRAKRLYKKAVLNVLSQHRASDLFSDDLTFGRGVQYAAQEFENLLKVECEVSVPIPVSATSKKPLSKRLVSMDSEGSVELKKKDCFTCTDRNCTGCENWLQKMAIT